MTPRPLEVTRAFFKFRFISLIKEDKEEGMVEKAVVMQS
jgi:hypothetical protein